MPGVDSNFAGGAFLYTAAGTLAIDAGLMDASAQPMGPGIWAGSPDSVLLVAKNGMPAPGAGEGVTYGSFSQFSFSSSGRIAFIANLTGPGIDATNTTTLYAGPPDNLKIAARSGDRAPDTHFTFAGIQNGVYGPADPVTNRSGLIAFYGTLNNPDHPNQVGLWAGDPSALHLAALVGEPAPQTAPGVVYSALNGPIHLNSAGQLAFIATLQNADGSSGSGIFAGMPGSLNLVVRDGAPAPGTGELFESFGYTPLLNGLGQVAFEARLTHSNDSIWATLPDGKLKLVARVGDLFEVAPGDFRAISSIAFDSSAITDDSGNMSFNNQGQLAFSAVFSDGSSGVFIAQIPEPGITGLLAVAASPLLLRRRPIH